MDGRGAVPLGSSPRMRGKRSGADGVLAVCGLIPARAGKTSRTGGGSWGSPAHPRACGENAAAAARVLTAAGSSPRVRGKRLGCGFSLRGWRLIPARAGKTLAHRRRSTRTTAHPRACGENIIDGFHKVVLDGSSPRVRGKQHPAGAGRRRRRLIPARAGKTGPRTPTRGAAPAHPRACGENHAGVGLLSDQVGSSPRVRGKHRGSFLGLGGGGLIPARAGKTAGVVRRLPRPQAHPRACGENVAAGLCGGGAEGSSPRVRGKPRAGMNR